MLKKSVYTISFVLMSVKIKLSFNGFTSYKEKRK